MQVDKSKKKTQRKYSKYYKPGPRHQSEFQKLTLIKMVFLACGIFMMMKDKHKEQEQQMWKCF